MVAAAVPAEGASDVDYLADVINQRLETQRTGAEVPWLNPSTGSGGDFVILRTDDSDPEQPCRTYRRTTERPGEPTIVVEGNACRIGPALWQWTETAVPSGPGPNPAPAPPAARADREPALPPFEVPLPPRKPDPDVFYASTPTPSVY